MNAINFNQLTGGLGPRINYGDQSYLYFGGTAYLGIPQNKRFLAHYLEGVHTFGLNNGTSRSNNVQLGIYDDAEKAAAQRHGAEAALITSSGYLAAQLTVLHFAAWGQVVYAPQTHPALWVAGNPGVSGSFGYWSRHVVELINKSRATRWVLVSNSINNLFPESYDFSFLKGIDPGKEIMLIVDDSHGIGVLGQGLGCFPSLPQLPFVHVVVVASMAKALGVDAGMVLSSAAIIRQLKKTPVFLGASPPAAAGLYAFMQAEKIYEAEVHKLQSLCRYFSAGLGASKAEFAAMDGFPVYLSEDQQLADALLQQKVLISSFAYPDQDGELLNRIVLSSWHQEEDLDILLKLMRCLA
ncbi:aminotransferase class I/II-fold pyridoxal phosphate-dependent enzyme [Pedobacter immunditicola]|uniref:aminotransferase class I/II-fold pyridoxal phosphate-dependent enzyme n=1 Tax=Pedobacter immunditicola TaxID=3133440 RepID=UPI003098B1A0